MPATLDRIADVARRAQSCELDTAAALDELASLASGRGGSEGRRAAGAFFTAPDLSAWLARRAIGGWLLERLGHAPLAERLLSNAGDPRAALARLVADGATRDQARARLTSLIVLDPTCGAGAFLVAAWQELLQLERLLDAAEPAGPTSDRERVAGWQLAGVDIDAHAAEACRVALHLVGAAGARVVCADSLQAQLDAAGPPDVVLGNPPYVRAPAREAPVHLATRSVPNRSAWIVERALAAAAPGARVSFVLPVSTSCTTAFEPARATWREHCDLVHTSHFDTIPATLFPGVVQRLSVFEGRAHVARSTARSRWWTTGYHRWLRDERAELFERVRHVPLPPQTVDGAVAKVGSQVELELLDLLFRHPPSRRFLLPPGGGDGANRLAYKRRWSYFLLFTDFVPPIWNGDGTRREPSEFKLLDVDPVLDRRVLLSVYSSTLFWWYFSVFTDNRNVNRRDLAAFPLPPLEPALAAELATLCDELMDALRACAEVRTCTYRSIGVIRNTYFRQGATRPVIDRIDHVLARAVGLDEQQLDFVLAFERRFRS